MVMVMTMKRKIRVTMEKDIEIEIMPSMFIGMTEEEYLKEFSETFWTVNNMDDIFKFAAKVAAVHGRGEEEGLGMLEPKHMKGMCKADVYYGELVEDITAEFID